MKNSIIFLDKLRRNNGAAWIENNTIAFSIPEIFQNPETKKIVVENKFDLIEILTKNNIFSKDIFSKKAILKTTTNKESVLSFSQQRLWFIESYEGGTNAYHMPIVLELLKGAEVPLFEQAIQSVIQRHEVLHSVIEPGENNEGQQVVHEEPLAINHYRYERSEYKAALQIDIDTPFDLEREYPIRVCFYEVVDKGQVTNRYALILMHHIAGDGWSTEVFAKELDAYYKAYTSGNTAFELPALPIQYSDYAVWERNFLTGDVLSDKLSYWETKLAGYQTLDLPTDYTRPAQLDYKGNSIDFVIPEKLSTPLRKITQQQGVTLHSVLLSSVAILLGKYSNQDDILIGSPHANRDHHQTAGLVGFFINTVVNRVLLDKQQSFEELITAVHQDQLSSHAHQDFPFEQLLDHLSVERDASRNPLFQVLFTLQSFRKNEIEALSTYAQPVPLGEANQIEKFDLSISMDDSSTAIKVEMSYATSLFSKETIERFAAHYLVLLESLVNHSKEAYQQHSLLDAASYQTMVYDWNTTEVAYPKEETIVSLFEAHADKTPDAIALVYKGQELSYKELNEKSNQLAVTIRKSYTDVTWKVLQVDTIIALCVERSLEMVIGILGILKAGAAYVPIDPNLPKDRMDFMLEDTEAKLILTQQKVAQDQLSYLPEEQLLVIDLEQEFYQNNAVENLSIKINPEDLCYVIYTSGTTGKPKGVMQPHGNVIRLFSASDDSFNFTKKDVWTMYHSYVFDFSVWELWGALLYSGKLVLPSVEEVKDLNKFYDLCKKQGVTILNQTPSAYYQFLEVILARGYKDFRYIIFGGEALNVNRLTSWWDYKKEENIDTVLINMYGITETTVHVTYKELAAQETSFSNIGKPLSDLKAYVLDNFQNPVPVGVIGELYIGGAGIARGYLNREDLTKERFIENPYASGLDKQNGYTRIYKTGDLVRWLADGSLEYMGRNDDQVKIRGYRIELGEIEDVLSRVQGISQSCILAKERTTDSGISKYLVGYYVVSDADTSISSEALIAELSKHLPDYMIPSAFVAMEAFPMTVNGKLDRRALPDPEFTSTESYVAPQTDLEKELSAIWESVLGLEQVGITDNFFRIGGNSILAMQLVHKINEAHSLGIKVADLFKFPTIKQLLADTEREALVVIPKLSQSSTPLSFSQQRLWFIESYEGGTNAYHMPIVLELLGDAEVPLLEQAMQSVIQRHEVLRSVIKQGKDNQGEQVVQQGPLAINHYRYERSEYKAAVQAHIDRPFDLEKEYPIRVCFYEVVDQGQITNRYALIVMHHIAGDGWSMEVFAKELDAYYKAYKSGNTAFELEALAIQYSDYALWKRNLLTGSILSDKLSYWETKLAGFQTLDLPTDYTRPAQLDYKGNSIHFAIPEKLSTSLREITQQQGATLHSVLLSSVAILLGKYSNQEDILIGSPHANRDHYQTAGLIGFFINTLVNRVLLEENQSFEELITAVHQDQVRSHAHQDFPFEQLLDHLSVERDASRNPLFQVMFALQSFGQNEVTALSEYAKPVGLGNDNPIEKFDLSIFMDDSSAEIKVQMSYATSLFAKETIERLGEHYLVLLESLVSHSKESYQQHSLLDTQSYQTMVYDWNATEQAYPKEQTIVSLFEAQAAKTPNAIALVYENQELSYKALNEKSNQLALEIRNQYKKRTRENLQADTLIALCLERSLEMIIGILGVLKAGAAYVPIDPEYPKDRMDFMLEDTKAAFVLTQNHIAQDQLSYLAKEQLLLIDLEQDFYQNNAVDKLSINTQPEDLCYVIYTSGTTGKPKGVMIEHKDAAYYLFIFNKKTGNNHKRVCSILNYCFDGSLPTLLSIAVDNVTLYIMKTASLSENTFRNYIIENQINKIRITPSILEATDLTDLGHEITIVLGGERFPLQQINKLLSNKNINLYNQYGPTECAVGSTLYELNKKIDSQLIGKPYPNKRAYVLDKFQNPVPVGVIGELYIGGAGIARGYLKRSELTEELFIENPFVINSDRDKGYTRIYKTGDFVRWSSEGNLEYIGRNDDQIKIRGYRIELGEIQDALSKVEGISQSCVLVKERITESGLNQYLVGYYITSEGITNISSEVLIDELSKTLPDYMIPNIFVAVEAFPMTVNGKLDRRALPDPEFTSTENYVAPQTDLEKELSAIWESVLGLEQVGITDNFFRIGGNSILAMQLVHKINEAHSLGIKVADLFKTPTIKQLLADTEREALVVIPKLSQSSTPLSFSQQRLWFIESYEGGTNAYHMPVILELLGDAEVPLLEQAMQAVIQRHEVLRSVIKQGKNNQGEQVVQQGPLVINHYRYERSEYKAAVQAHIDRPFVLEKEYPIRVCFYEVVDQGQVTNRYALIVMHHIAGDGWSMEVFAKELDAYYKAYKSGNTAFELEALAIQYSDYALWERNLLTGTILSNKLSYWETKLAGFQTLDLPTDYTRPAQLDYKGNSIHFAIPEKLSTSLRKITQQQGATLHSVLLSSVAILLGKYSNQEDILIGSPHANRDHYQTAGLIGFFINTLVNRVLLEENQSFEELITAVHQDQVRSHAHQDFPFEQLLDHLSVERDASRNPLFQVMFALQSFGQNEVTALSEYAKPVGLGNDNPIEKFDLSIFMDDSNAEIKVQMSYATSLFAKETIERLGEHYLVLLENLVSHSKESYQQHSLLDAKSYQTMVYDWNATEQAYPKEQTIVSLFEAQAAKTPNAIALVYENQELSYKALDEKSNQLALEIRNQYEKRIGKDLQADTLIALCLERSLEMIIGILGVLKAGAAYVPIDPNFPKDRMDFMLEDTQAAFVLTQNHIAQDQLSYLAKEQLLLIDLEQSFYQNNAVENLSINTQPEDLCYVIYTSGTTGKPKGVMIPHSGIVNRLDWMQSMYPLTDSDSVLQKTPYIFDVSVWELLWANLYGAKIVLAKPEGHKDTAYLYEVIQQHKITTLHFVPSMLAAYNYYLSEVGLTFNQSIHQLFCSGEALSKKAVDETYKNTTNKSFKLHNLYGPTEASIDVTFYQTSIDKEVYIGKPIANTQAYVLDKAMHPVPVGVIGELYIGGAGVARGYLNREDLTTERFLENPYASELDKQNDYTRIYKTGDLVRWLADGNLEYIGRNDDQVKIRGYRIELGEIEDVLSKVQGVSQSCILAKERTTDSGISKYLVGYYVSVDTSISSEVLIAELSKHLPDYMIPSAFVAMEAFPMTVNGKLDRRALPDPEFTNTESYVAPQTDLEKELSAIWESVLGLEQVGITDNFFRIGGDSILSIQVSGRIRDLGYTCQVKDLFNNPTIQRLSNYLESATDLVAIERETAILTGEFAYLPIQHWFFERLHEGEFNTPGHWNQSFIIRVPSLDKEQLVSALESLVEHHDMFRIHFKDGKQSYQASIALGELKELDVSSYNTAQLSEILTNWQSHFSIEQGPLFQFGYLHGYKDGSARIFMALHHLIVDGVSWRVLASDLEKLYNGKTLAPKGSSYRQWVAKIKEYPNLYASEADYWSTQLSDIPSYESLKQKTASNTKTIKFTKQQTKALLQDCSKAYHSEVNDLLLTALGTALGKLTDSNIAGLSLEGHGRELLFDTIDHSNTLGWYTSIFPVRLSISGDISQDIRTVKEELRRIPNKGVGFGSFAVLEDTDYGFADLPKVSFNYLGQFDGAGSNKDWQLVSESSGAPIAKENQDPNIITINGAVVDELLQFSISTRMSASNTKQLVDVFKDTLSSIISHCQQQLLAQGSWFTPSDFAFAKMSMPLLDQLQEEALQQKNTIEAIYPANSLQQGFLYHAIEQPQDDAYRVQLLLDYDMDLNIPNYLKAWEYCIAKYPILRTAFNWDRELLQVIYKKGILSHTYHDLSDLDSQEAIDNQIKTIQKSDRNLAYNMKAPSLFRLHIIKQRDHKYTVLKSNHHSISDGWSLPVVIGQQHEYYQQIEQGTSIKVTEDTVYKQAQEYIQVQQASVKKYWKESIASLDTLMDINPLLDASLDFTNYREVISPKQKNIEINDKRYKDIKGILQQQGITVNILVQFLWHKLLSVYGNSAQTIVGTTVSGRDLPIQGIENSAGLYINTLPLMVDWSLDRTALEQLHHIQEQLSALSTNSSVNLSSLHLEGQRLFQSLLVFENYPISEEVKKGNGLAVSVRDTQEKTDYPLEIIAHQTTKGITISLKYDGHYLSEKKADSHIEAISSLLDQLIEDIHQPISALSVLSQQSYQTMVYDWNATEQAYPKEQTIVSLFEAQVAKTPNAIALVYQDQELSYKALNEKSNQLALEIRNQYKKRIGKDLQADTLIALCLERSLEMIIGILGVLKAGAAYVPIDPNFPKDRMDFMLEDTQAAFVLTQHHIAQDQLSYLAKEQLLLIDLEQSFYQNNAVDKLSIKIKPEDLCYVIYTSGTTGKPKGVMIPHSGIVNRLDWMQSMYPLTDSDSVLQKTPYIFDVSVWELLWANLYGAKIVLAKPEGHKDTAYLYEVIQQHKITTLHFVPSMLAAYNYYLSEVGLTFNQSIHQLFCSGEALSKKAVDETYKNTTNQSFKLHNLYGPTEASIDVTFYQTSIDKEVYIGKPIANTQAYVLDKAMHPVPVGVIGELYIGGVGIARGYLNREDLTKERFIDNPYASELDKQNGYTRIYKTGDLVRWLADGNLEYMGRNDDQVKIRGYRIELGEIEDVLSKVQGISQSCILAKERTTDSGISKYLVGYYVVSDADNTISSEALIDELSKTLPDYMIPSAFVAMEAFPMTVNGKLDRRALPDPEFTSTESYVAPQTDLEKELSAIWESVLGLEQVGITDNFFRIGGDSILSIQVSGRIRDLGYTCQVKDLFNNPTIQRLSNYLESATDLVAIERETAILTGEFAYLPIQHWFFERLHEGEFNTPGHWNQSFIIRVPSLDKEQLVSALESLVEHHDMFRIHFKDGKQSYQASITLGELKELDVSSYNAAQLSEILTNWQSHFSIEQGPLFQFGYLHGYKDGSARIFMALHHLIVDGVSWRVLASDLEKLYNGKTLAPKGSSYRQWVAKIKEYPNLYASEADYWSTQLSDIPSYESLKQEAASNTKTIKFTKQQTKALLQDCSKAYHSEVNDLLLTALGTALGKLTDSNIAGLSLEGHGRELLFDTIDHSNTLGWYTSIFPVRLFISGDLSQDIRTVKEELRRIPNKGVGFGSFAVLDTTHYGFCHLPKVSFNYLGQFDGAGSNKDWQLVSESSGAPIAKENQDPNIITINGAVVDELLQFSISTRMSASNTKQLVDVFKDTLSSIISHCQQQLLEQGSWFTPSDFAFAKMSMPLLDQLQEEALQAKNTIEAIYPANSLQQGFLYHAIEQPQDDAYRVQLLLDYDMDLNIPNYLKAWEYCIAKYPILRTAFNWDRELLQVIYKKGILSHSYHDLSDLDSQEAIDNQIKTIQKSDRNLAYNMKAPSLFRLHIIKQRDNKYTVLKSNHHSISDGWSLPVVIGQQHEYYQQIEQGTSIKVTEDTVYKQAQEYIQVQQASVKKYWKESIASLDTLMDINPLLDTSLDFTNYREVISPKQKNIEINDKRYKDIKGILQQQGITVNILVQFLWHKLLSVYGNSAQTIVGTTVSGRDLPIQGIENSAGLYINTLPLMVDWSLDRTALEQLHHIQEQLSALSTNSSVNLSSLHLEGQRLFQSLLVFENYPISEEVKKGNGLAVSVRDTQEKTDYPLEIIAHQTTKGITISLKYDGHYLSEKKANSHIEAISSLLDQLIEDIHQPQSALSVLSQQSYQTMVYDWNATEQAYPKEQTIVSLFETQVAKTPNAIALVYENQELSYKALDEKSNQLALEIRNQYKKRTQVDLQADTLIALCLERSLEMIIGILGVLKAGAAYVPIDPNFPKDRMDFMLEDTQAAFVLTQHHIAQDQLSYLAKEQLLLIDLEQSFYQNNAVENLSINTQPEDLCYVIYTSGTTGKPKGVMIEHISFAQFIYNFKTILNEGKSEKVLLSLTNYVFDIFGLEYALPLLSGHSILLSSLENVTKEHLVQADIIQQTPTTLDSLLRKWSSTNLLSNKTVLVGGELLPISIGKKLSESFKKVFNVYGPSETVIWSSINEINGDNNYIGKPLDNEKVYVLDSAMHPVPVGVIGELYIGGAGIARGYLNREDLTTERFIDNPYASALDKQNGYTRIYKTGDLVRWLADGNLEYMGRNDDQVKIRGYRIELEEIQDALSKVEGISQSCVLVKERITESGLNQYLVGYYITSEGITNISSEVLIDELSKTLPDYMIPNIFVAVEAFPMTVNGKLDRRALPDPEFTNTESYVAPQTDLEKELSAIWESVLGLEQVGTTDNFFRIGGNSILAMQLVHKINEAHSLGIKVADLFKTPTIKQLLADTEREALVVIPKLSQNSTPLSFSQQRLWFIESYEGGTNAYHMPVVLELLGDAEVPLLEQAMQTVIQRHEVLRSVIKQGENNQGEQVVQQGPLAINHYRYERSEYKAAVQAHIDRPFDLEKEYPIRVCFYEVVDQGQIINRYALIVMHHIAGDGWSMEVFAKELDAYYKAYKSGNTAFELEALAIQYSDYALWERNLLTGNILSDKLSYWETKLAGFQTLDLPTDYTRPAQLDYKGNSIHFAIPEKLSTSLREITQQQGATLHSVLLSSVAILLGKYSNQDDILIGSPHANRDHYQTAGLIGFFINTLVNRVLLEENQSFEELITAVHQDQVRSHAHQDFPFEQLLDHLSVERDASRNPLFQVMFALQSFGQNEVTALSEYAKPVGLENGNPIEKFDLSIFMDDSNAEIKVQMSYATSLFAKETIERLGEHYLVLLENLVSHSKESYQQHSLLDAKSYQTMVYDWNATEQAYPKEQTIVSLFEAQVAKTPNAIALVYQDQELSYKALNEKSNQLALEIRNQYKKRIGKDLQADTLIALCLERSLEMIIGILGVLKAGAAYVPIDPNFPKDRMDFMLEDTQAVFLLTQHHIAQDQLSYLAKEQLLLIDLEQDFYQNNAVDKLSIKIKPEDLCYVIYTSGTTGKPKGVMIPHSGIVNRLDWMQSMYPLTDSDSVLQKTPYIFDVSVWELLWANLYGAKIVLAKPEGHKDTAYLYEVIQQHKITTLHFVPSMLAAYNYYLSEVGLTFNQSIHQLFCSGEALSKKAVDETYKNTTNQSFKLHNLYGPTEASIDVTFYQTSIDKEVYIGKPIANTQAYVLDKAMHPVPVGVIGELYIGGAGIARGYLNREDLTTERFLDNPYASELDKQNGYTRIYKTGDLVRWLADGNLEYMGRNDDQVKIRGYRIELGEIEDVLSKVQGISQSCILAKERTTDSGISKYLVGYYVLSDADTSIPSEVLIAELSKHLPDYMIPSAFVAMEAFPMTVNGKLDRRALPDPEFTSTESYVAPQTDLEKELSAIWESVLGLEQVGITDNFFRIGGDSILAMQLVHKINEEHSIGIKISDVFEYPTIKFLTEKFTLETMDISENEEWVF